jgi:hypothetical protein
LNATASLAVHVALLFLVVSALLAVFILDLNALTVPFLIAYSIHQQSSFLHVPY